MVYRRARRRVSYRPRRRFRGARAPRRRLFGVNRRRMRLNRRVGGFLGVERKFLDAYNTASLGSTIAGGEKDPAATSVLVAPAQGVGESQRVGRKYRVESIQLNGHLIRAQQSGVTAGLGASHVNIAVVLDTQTNAAQLNAEDVFTSPGGSLPDHPFRNLQYRSRFRVLWHKVITVHEESGVEQSATTSNLVSTRPTFRMYKKVKIPVTCSGTDATVSSIQDNSLHIVAWSSNSSGTYPDSIYYNARMRFTDL